MSGVYGHQSTTGKEYVHVFYSRPILYFTKNERRTDEGVTYKDIEIPIMPIRSLHNVNVLKSHTVTYKYN